MANLRVGVDRRNDTQRLRPGAQDQAGRIGAASDIDFYDFARLNDLGARNPALQHALERMQVPMDATLSRRLSKAFDVIGVSQGGASPDRPAFDFASR